MPTLTPWHHPQLIGESGVGFVLLGALFSPVLGGACQLGRDAFGEPRCGRTGRTASAGTSSPRTNRSSNGLPLRSAGAEAQDPLDRHPSIPPTSTSGPRRFLRPSTRRRTPSRACVSCSRRATKPWPHFGSGEMKALRVDRPNQQRWVRTLVRLGYYPSWVLL